MNEDDTTMHWLGGWLRWCLGLGGAWEAVSHQPATSGVLCDIARRPARYIASYRHDSRGPGA